MYWHAAADSDDVSWHIKPDQRVLTEPTLLMIPPLSTTPSAPTMTRSTFSNTYLWKRKKDVRKNIWIKKVNYWDHLFLKHAF